MMTTAMKRLYALVNAYNRDNDFDLRLRWTGTPDRPPVIECYEEADGHVLAAHPDPTALRDRIITAAPSWDLSLNPDGDPV